jgi:hypothetical protein
MNMITVDRSVVQQALETIEGLTRDRLFTAEWAGKHGATIAALRAVLAEPQPNTLHGWVFKRNADGSVGIFAPPPKPGESRRTSDCVGPQDRDLNELLGKLADHMAALPESVEPVAYREDIIRMAREAASEDGSIDRKDGKNVVLYAAKTSRFLERIAALVAAAEREAIMDEWSACVQSDLENGVRWLNEQAAKKWQESYPAMAGFADKIYARGETK